MDKTKELNGIKRKIVLNYILHIALMIPLVWAFFVCVSRITLRTAFVFFLVVVILFMLLVMALFKGTNNDLVNTYEKIKRFYELSEKYKFPSDGVKDVIGDICYNSLITYRCEAGAGFITDKSFLYFWKNKGLYNFLEVPKENLISIQEKDLISFTVTGDKDYITRISGGGGGGSSIGGGVVGGLLGGTAGAVIGSRKEIQPITTSVTKIDNRNTIVNCMVGEQNVHFVFTGGDMYDQLIKLSPSKELGILTQTAVIQENNDADVTSRLRKIKELLECELISKEEYEEKREEILSEL